ncbi:MAG: FtsW/RodA/SpoVE family cell cycle protein [Egibacteraceae bacterium]
MTTPASADHRRRSNTELGLLVLGIIVSLSAYALVGLTVSSVVPAGLLPYGGALIALALAGHLMTRRLAAGADPLLLPLAFVLNGLGLVMVRRIDFALAAEEAGQGAQRAALAPLQTVWTVVGVAAFCATVALVRDHRALDRYRYLIGAASLVLLLLPLVPGIGQEIRGARIWLDLGVANFQPGEFAKLGIVVFFASFLAEKRPLLSVATSRVGPLHVPPARAFAPIATAWIVSLAVLIFEKDLGLSLLFFGIFVVLLYIATARLAYVVAGVGLFGAGAYLAWRAFAHVQQRIAIWLNPWPLADSAAFQPVQSLFALGSGGVAGVGWGQGRPQSIPDVQTDFIFSAFGEELGLLGLTALLLCYFIFIGRGFSVAMQARDDFGTLLAAGLVSVFALQVFVIVGGVTRLIPLTGLTLPFLSYGGSSLLANYVLVALLLRVSADQAQAR